jgi:hypothetical protein
MPPEAGAGKNGYEDEALDRLAEEVARRLAARLGGLMPGQTEALVDAAEIARIYGKTRSWVYEHAGELGAVRLGNGPRPRLAFSPGRVAASLERVADRHPRLSPSLPSLGVAGSVSIGRPRVHRYFMSAPTRPRATS